MKLLGWLFALLPLAGIALFYSVRAPNVPGMGSGRGPGSSERAIGASGVEKTTRPGSSWQSRQTKAEELEAAGRTQNTVEGLAAIARDFTPERQSQLVDAYMRSRKQGYEDLFKSWDLDAATANSVLDAVRKRETQLWQNRFRFLLQKRGPGVGKVLKDIAAETDASDVELVILLGHDRFTELAEKEALMNLESQRRAEAYLQSRRD